MGTSLGIGSAGPSDQDSKWVRDTADVKHWAVTTPNPDGTQTVTYYDVPGGTATTPTGAVRAYDSYDSDLERAPNYTVVTADGNIPAGSIAYAFVNSGAIPCTVMGADFAVGQTMEFDDNRNGYYPQIDYVIPAGGELRVAYTMP